MEERFERQWRRREGGTNRWVVIASSFYFPAYQWHSEGGAGGAGHTGRH